MLIFAGASGLMGWSSRWRFGGRMAWLVGALSGIFGGEVQFRNEMEVGPGGRQIQLEDLDGNAIELFEPAM